MLFHPGLISFLQCSWSLFWLHLMGEVPVECNGTQAQTQQFVFCSQVMPPSLNRILKNSSEIRDWSRKKECSWSSVLCYSSKKNPQLCFGFPSRKLYLGKGKRTSWSEHRTGSQRLGSSSALVPTWFLHLGFLFCKMDRGCFAGFCEDRVMLGNSFDTKQMPSIIILKSLLSCTIATMSNNKRALRCWRMFYVGLFPMLLFQIRSEYQMSSPPALFI